MTSPVEFAVPSATVASFSRCRILLCATGTEASSVSGAAPVPVTVAMLTMGVPPPAVELGLRHRMAAVYARSR